MTHQWYYMKSGMIKDDTVGPLTQGEIVKALRDGTLKRDTLILSPTQTQNNWYEVQQIPKLLEIWVQGHEAREAEKAHAREERQRLKEDQKRQAEAERRRRDEERRQAELEAMRQHQVRADQQAAIAHAPAVDAAPVPAYHNPPSQTSGMSAGTIALFTIVIIGLLIIAILLVLTMCCGVAFVC